MGDLFRNAIEHWNDLRKKQTGDGGLSAGVGAVINKPKPKPKPKPETVVVPIKPEQPAPKPSGKITTGRDADEGTPDWYRRMFTACEIDQGYEESVASSVRTVLRGEDRYRIVENRTGVPWWIVGVIHFKESSCNFDGILHNGQRGIIGEYAMKHNVKSTIVPKGVGPFRTWEDAAVHALAESNRWRKIAAGGRDIGEILYAMERFNGQGYLSKTSEAGAENSPYLWARSNINDGSGKYVRDHVFDPNAPTNKTTGAAVILKELWKSGRITLEV